MNVIPATAQIWNKVIPNSITKSGASNNTLTAEMTQQMRKDIEYLTSSVCEGRKAGTKGEENAGIYIEQRMNAIGLKPYNSRSFRHHFKFESDKTLSKNCVMTLGNAHVFIPEDVFPTAFSAMRSELNYLMPRSQEPNAPWVLPLYNNITEAKDKGFDWEKRAYDLAKKAAGRGASSVILYDEFSASNRPAYKQSSNYASLDIPVLIMHQAAYEKYVKDIRVITPTEINIELAVQNLIGTNMIGYIDNKAEKTIVIGAHYDHLGTTKAGDLKYYQGADDNASGVALMLAVASKVVNSNIKNYNFLFIAFSAHEYGMNGSKAFLASITKNNNEILCFLNLDKVGRMPVNNKFQVQGTGSAAVWPDFVMSSTTNQGIEMKKNFLVQSENSDFSALKIPSLLVTTGDHKDLATVYDNAQKLNYTGMESIGNFLIKFLYKSTSATEKPIYTKVETKQKEVQP